DPNRCLQGWSQFHHFYGAVKEQEQYDQRADEASGPQAFFRNRSHLSSRLHEFSSRCFWIEANKDKDWTALPLPRRSVMHQADLAFTFAHYFEEAFGPFDRLVLGLHLDHRIAADELLRFGERSVSNCKLSSRDTNAGALRAGLEPLRREKHAGLRHLLD